MIVCDVKEEKRGSSEERLFKCWPQRICAALLVLGLRPLSSRTFEHVYCDVIGWWRLGGASRAIAQLPCPTSEVAWWANTGGAALDCCACKCARPSPRRLLLTFAGLALMPQQPRQPASSMEWRKRAPPRRQLQRANCSAHQTQAQQQPKRAKDALRSSTQLYTGTRPPACCICIRQQRICAGCLLAQSLPWESESAQRMCRAVSQCCENMRRTPSALLIARPVSPEALV